ALAYQFGWSKSRALATTNGTRVHSRRQYHGALVALWTLVPAVLFLAIWAFFSPGVTHWYTVSQLPTEVLQGLDQIGLNQQLQRIRDLASGYGVTGDVQPFEQAASVRPARFQLLSFLIMIAAAAGLGVLGLWFAQRRINPRLRARNEVEHAISWALIACSAVAIFTTLGIVASLGTDAFRLFTYINLLDFFFGTVRAPKFSSTGTGDAGQYGLLPLLAGTLMISAIAMLVAVPIGLMTAIYLNQYAHRSVRKVVKPIIEVLAGIPTIVYGFFALVTVGPFLRDFGASIRSEEHTSELQSRENLVCRLLLEKKKIKYKPGEEVCNVVDMIRDSVHEKGLAVVVGPAKVVPCSLQYGQLSGSQHMIDGDRYAQK